MDRMVQPKFQVRILGGFELSAADGNASVSPRRILRALIALLALAPPTGWPREELAHMLWGDRDAEQARASLRQALAEVRRIMGEACILTDRETAVLNPMAVSVDAAEFVQLAKAGEVEKAAVLYRGELLEGINLAGGAFADWLLVERTRFHDMAARVFDRLLATQSGEAAISTAQRLLQTDPFREDAHRALMRLFAEQGNRSLALRQYQICRDSLQRELGVKPEAETEQLCRDIQSASKGATTVPPGVVTAAPAAAESGREPRGLKWFRIQTVAIGLLLAVMVVSAAWWVSQEISPGLKPVVAVLPFDDLAGDKDSHRLARGLTEDIITDLARFPEFKVIARNTIEAYDSKKINPVDAGVALNAGYVVKGSIQRQLDRVRISAQLFDASTGSGLWSQRWDRPDKDLFAIQSEISEQIANRLGGGNGLIQEAGRIAAHRKPPNSLTAYELYLLGTEKLEQVNRADVEEALVLLTRAVELDPGLARAWVELHHTHSVLANLGADMETHYRLAIEAAESAVKLDPSDAEAHAVYAASFGYANDLARAKAEFEVALRMAPNQFEILVFYISWASAFGEAERGADLVDEAVRLNPNYPMWAARPFAYAYFMVGRYEDALRMMGRIEKKTLGTWLWPFRAGSFAALGRAEEAKAAVKEALAWYPDLTIEGTVNEPGYSDAERKRVTETMRLAGFPPCAKPEALAKIDKPRRLPECQSQP